MKQKGVQFLLRHKNALFACVFGIVLIMSFLAILWGLNSKTHWVLPEKIRTQKQLLNTAEIAFHERFGAPASRMHVANSVVLQYRNDECVMSLFLDNHRSKNKNIKKSQYVLFTNRHDLTENKNCLNSFLSSPK